MPDPKIKLPKPSTNQFHQYITEALTPFLYDSLNRDQANQLILVLYYLENERYDFTAERAYQTRPICIKQIAEHFRVTERSTRRWMATLERLGILKREFRKDPLHKFKNKFSRFSFVAFQTWFGSVYAKAKTLIADSLCPPTEKAISDSNIRSEENPQEELAPLPFPSSGGVTYSPHWRDLALKFLPSGPKRPCATMIAERFRQNLKQYDIPLNHPSLTKRWTNFCSNAKPCF